MSNFHAEFLSGHAGATKAQDEILAVMGASRSGGTSPRKQYTLLGGFKSSAAERLKGGGT
jgi:hypothetical protein